MKRNGRRLELQRESLRNISTQDLAAIQGAARGPTRLPEYTCDVCYSQICPTNPSHCLTGCGTGGSQILCFTVNCAPF